MVLIASDFGWRVSFVVRGIWAVPESAMALCIVAQVVSTVVRMVDDKYFGLFITHLRRRVCKLFQLHTCRGVGSKKLGGFAQRQNGGQTTQNSLNIILSGAVGRIRE